MSRPNGQQTVPSFSRDEELAAYRQMLLIRRFEERAAQLYGMGLIGGFCHLYIGQEAVVVGMQMAIEQGDQVITTYRDHGHMLATGMDPKGVMAELTGRQGGYSRARVVRCTCSPRKRTSTGATASSVPTYRWAQVSPLPTAIVATGGCVSPTLAMAPPTKARSMKASTWRSCGSCRSCSSLRTTSMRWAHRWNARPPLRTSRSGCGRLISPANKSTAWTCAP